MLVALFGISSVTQAVTIDEVEVGNPAVAYDVVEIVPTSYSEDNYGSSLNNRGIGVGRMSTSSSTADRGLIFRDGASEKIGILPSTGPIRFSEAYGINDADQVVGHAQARA